MYELQMALDRFPSPVDAVFEAKSFNTEGGSFHHHESRVYEAALNLSALFRLFSSSSGLKAGGAALAAAAPPF